jgi:hypothetical protein
MASVSAAKARDPFRVWRLKISSFKIWKEEISRNLKADVGN